MTIVNSSNVSKELKRLNITEGDLSLLFNASENAVLSFLDKDTDRTRILGTLYFNPYLLYESDLETEELVEFTLNRYKAEQSELYFQYENADISSDEYNSRIEKLNNHYFDNSIFGRNIKRMIEKEMKKEKVLNKSLIK